MLFSERAAEVLCSISFRFAVIELIQIDHEERKDDEVRKKEHRAQSTEHRARHV